MYNRITLMGRLTRAPEMRYSQGGTAVLKFGLAVNTYAGKDRDDNVLFVDCVAFGGRAENIQKYFSKGDGILVEGELRLNEWEKDGEKKRKHEVAVFNFAFPTGKKGERSGSGATGKTEEDYSGVDF